MADPNQSDLLNVPTSVTVTDVVDHEVDPRKKAQLETLGRKDAGDSGTRWGALWASLMDGGATVITIAAALFDKFMTLAGTFFHAAQGEQNPQFWELVATIISDLTGTEVNAETLKQARFGSGRLAGMQATGNALYSQLKSEFAPSDTLTPDGGEKAAQAFLGFLMSFAVRQGNVALLAEFIPEEANVLKGFREYGEMMAKNLGLGRLARRALTPLIQTTIADPLQWKLNQQYRPHLLSPSSAVRAWTSGYLTDSQMREQLSLQGFSETKIDALIQEGLTQLTLDEINTLRAFGLVADQDALLYIRRTGYEPVVADLALKALDRREIVTASRNIANRLVHEYTQGIITADELSTAMGKLALTDAERAGFEGLAGTLNALPRKELTLSEMHKAFLQGVITVNDWEDYLIRVGYRQDDRAILTNMLLLDLAHQGSSKTAKAPPQLSWTQLKAAYKAGILTHDQVQAHLTHHGYTSEDINTLLLELPPPKPPAA